MRVTFKSRIKRSCSQKNDWIGGAAVSRELHPGIILNCSYVCSLFRPEIMRDLELPKHGLQIVAMRVERYSLEMVIILHPTETTMQKRRVRKV